MNAEFNHQNHKKDGTNYTHKAFPLHRDNNINFEDTNGIVTWADEIDYGHVENFGWPSSNSNIEYTYASLLEAIHNNFQFLWNEIQILKGSQVTTLDINRLSGSSDSTGNLINIIFKAIVENGVVGNTQWTLEEHTGAATHGGSSITCSSWLKSGGEKISPYRIFKAPETGLDGTMNTYQTSVNGERIGIVPTEKNTYLTDNKYDIYKTPLYALPSVISGTATFGNTGQSRTFNCGTGGTPYFYGAKLKASNNNATYTYSTILTYVRAPIAPDHIEWYIQTTGNVTSTGTNTYSLNGVTITLSDASSTSCKITTTANNATQNLSFTLVYKVTYSDDHIETSTKTCTIEKYEEVAEGYYWYVGQVDPRTLSEASAPIVTDTQSQGWRLVEDPDTYEFDAIASDKAIWSNPQSTATWYMGLPTDETVTAYDGFNNKIIPAEWGEYVVQWSFKGINYNVFILEESPSWGGYKIKK